MSKALNRKLFSMVSFCFLLSIFAGCNKSAEPEPTVPQNASNAQEEAQKAKREGFLKIERGILNIIGKAILASSLMIILIKMVLKFTQTNTIMTLGSFFVGMMFYLCVMYLLELKWRKFNAL